MQFNKTISKICLVISCLLLNISVVGLPRFDGATSFMSKLRVNTIPEYITWKAMKRRCYNPNNCSYKFYGGRGIAVCDDWKNNFNQFYKDMGKKPTNKHTLDRIDNNKNYEPSNCRWATFTDQFNNRRSCRKITYKRKTQSLKRWCNELSINYGMTLSRLKLGWDIKDAFETPSYRKQYKNVSM